MRALVAIALVLGACSREGPGLEVAAPAANPVQREMRLLHAAMQATLTGIAYGDVRAVPEAFEAIDRAKEATEAALASGAYVPARNGDRLDRFRELDEAFHPQLERIVEAARRGDVPATAEAMGAALRGCDPCHQEFRR